MTLARYGSASSVAVYAGALAGLIQGPRATSLTDGRNRPQMSYSLPAQLPDPDQHMHEVYLAAQAAAAGNTTQVSGACPPGLGGLPWQGWAPQLQIIQHNYTHLGTMNIHVMLHLVMPSSKLMRISG